LDFITRIFLVEFLDLEGVLLSDLDGEVLIESLLALSEISHDNSKVLIKVLLEGT
jgi:hypothetical protein